MQDNLLQLNDDKTEVLLISTRNSFQKVSPSLSSIRIGSTTVPTTKQAKNLGVVFDSLMNMEGHVNNMCKSAFFHLRNISRIRRNIDQPTAKKLIYAFVTSRLDYCNALLFGISDHLLSKVQRIQNMAARVVCKIQKSEHITPVLRRLHWLPIKARIQYKILLTVYKCLNGMAPKYL